MKQFKSFRLDTANECLWQQDRQIELSPKLFAVLRYLVEHPGRLITHDELLDALWPETYVQPQVLRTYVLELRKVLGDDAGQPEFIQTLPKRGYRFVMPVTAANEASLPPARPEQAEPAAIVGREGELAKLRVLLDSVDQGKRQVVLVTGEAGIGKTALVEAFCAQAGAGLTVACGQCVDGFGAKEEYYPVMEMLGQLCAGSQTADAERACGILSRMSPVWMEGLRRTGAHPAAVTAAKDEQRMPGDLCAALEELAREKPLLLVFEDLHWADAATIHLISALARRRVAARLMLIATCRVQQVSAGHPMKALKQDLLMRRLCAEIPLRPLAKAATRDLLSRELQQAALPPGLDAFVHRHSEGNPLFAIAIIEHLIADGALVRTEAAGQMQWTQPGRLEQEQDWVPQGLAQMIELEVDRLPAREQRMLEAGSLISVAFPAWAVAAALDEDTSEIEEACEALAQRLYFLERAGQDELPGGTQSSFFVFAHQLYREVLYQRQPASRRAKWHTRIAERLGVLFSGREATVAREMAFHFEAAGSWQRAADALRSAAAHAEQRQAYAEAAELLDSSLRVAGRLRALPQ